jgi:dipeptidyl aminopeptidase/acylaminoacyl peptidase
LAGKRLKPKRINIFLAASAKTIRLKPILFQITFSLQLKQEAIQTAKSCMKRTFCLLLFLLWILPAAAQPKRGLQPEDLFHYKEVADAQIAPDGLRVAYTVTEVSADRARNVTHIWIVSTSGGEPKRLLPKISNEAEADDTTPRWSPNGKWIAFYKQDGLWIANPDGGEAQMVTRVARTNFFFNKAGESFTWSPDSKRIAFLSDPKILPPTNPLTERLMRGISPDEIMRLPQETRAMILKAQGRSAEQIAQLEAEYKAQQAKQQNYTDDVRVISRLQYKSRTAFSDNLQSHIFIADVTTKQVRQLTSGNYAEHSIHWSPKGDEIVFVSNHEGDPDKVNNSDLFVVNVTTGDVRQLTKTKGGEWQPVFSPDGSQIAYLATTRDVTTIDSVAEDMHAWLIYSEGGEGFEVSKKSDFRVAGFKWVADKKLVLNLQYRGNSLLRFINIDGESTLAIKHPIIGNISIGQNSTSTKVAFVESRTDHVTCIRTLIVDRDPTIKPRLFTIRDYNDNFSVPELAYKDLRFTNEDFEIQGWLVPPLHLDEKKKYPLILYIHGGPHGMHGYSFNATVQALAAKGYGVLLINPRGSSGYGQKFADGCVNDWGGGDYRDLMRGVDVALDKFPFLDKDRMGVMGGSYGGYMTNWIVTQTDRFKAAIASASLSNLISFYSTSLYQDLIHAEFSGMPWDNYDKLWERSPLRHIKNVKTPTMLVHGENDNDVHITQAEEMYTALKMRGVDTVLIRYPREGHGIREPKHRVDNLQRVLDWFEKYLK